ncbi:MAG: hemK [Marmoricola sp.]|nr:hemK [Marmoricola sp.]
MGPPPDLVGTLRAAGCVFAEEEAALLLEAAAGSADDLGRLLDRRVAGEPLEQVLGWAEFDGLRVRVTPGVFVPRRRTEAMARRAVELAAAVPRPVVVDLCCGSGALALVVARDVPYAEVHAADLDPDAVACARLDLPADRVHEGDLCDALPARLRGRVDVLVCNAPYVPSAEVALMPTEARDHEHLLALDGGADGVDLHRRVAAQAATWLAPGGSLLLETSERQAPLSVAACEAAGLVARVHRDEEREATVVVAARGSRASIGPRAASSGKM